jgi:Biopolymer transport protein
MAFSSGGNKGPMADINVTPLVDVMLVLLIIFIVTAPIMTYPIEVALPQRVINPPPQIKEPPPPIELKINADGTLYWNNSPVNVTDLQTRMENEVQRDPTNQPETAHRGELGSALRRDGQGTGRRQERADAQDRFCAVTLTRNTPLNAALRGGVFLCVEEASCGGTGAGVASGVRFPTEGGVPWRSPLPQAVPNWPRSTSRRWSM